MFKNIYVVAFFIMLAGCSGSSSKKFDFKLTLEKSFSSPAQLFLSPDGNYDPDLLTFEVNDSVISASVNLTGEIFYYISLDGFPGIGDSFPETAKISYNGREASVNFTPETCSPRISASNIFYVEATNNEKFLLSWRICDQIESDFENLVLNTDYSFIELTTRHLDVQNNYQVMETIDTSFVILTDSHFVDKDFYPRRISSEIEDIIVQTSVKITNVQGPLPGQKGYLDNLELPILFYDKTSILSSIQVQN